MTQEKIKQDCQEMYDNIRRAEACLKKIREVCKHPNTSESNYSYRVGNIQPAEVCSDCGQFIKYL